MTKPLSEITGKYIGKSFTEMPCMHLMHGIYTDLSVDLPDSFGKLTIDNYQEYFRENPRLIQARMMQLIKSLGKPASVKSLKIYDLVVIMQPGLRPVIFPAVYVGRKMIITSVIKEGVVVARLDSFNRPILARRLI